MSRPAGGSASTRVELDLTVDESSTDEGVHVRGIVRMPGGVEQPFVGWVGLLALLQGAVSATTADDDPALPRGA